MPKFDTRLNLPAYGAFGTGYIGTRHLRGERDCCARYYGSAPSRFTNPDWSAAPQPVPYADLSDPQSLNQYAYVRNNPLGRTDPDGHCCWDYAVGFAKGTANRILDNISDLAKNGNSIQRVVNGAFQTDFRFSASGSDQQAGVQFGYEHGDTTVSLAVAVAGGKAGGSEALPEEALVVRGGVSVSESAVGTHPSGVTGISVESAAGKSVGQLASESPTVSRYGQINVVLLVM